MDGIRKIARAYYDRASEEEKDTAKLFFKKLDGNEDGKISLQEFKDSVSSWLNDEKLFRQLDTNGDGMLDFDEALALYHMHTKVTIHKCDVCRDLLMGPYFSCLPCQSKASYYLCCDCYRGGTFEHEHELSNFLDQHNLLEEYIIRNIDAQTHQEKKDMEELSKIAAFYYRALSPEIQVLAHKFFESLDTNGDGLVDIAEFKSFMRQEGYVNMRDLCFFKELDRDGNDTLDFCEVMTLYYIIKSGRPFCEGCKKFIPGIFFSCMECYKRSDGSNYRLCHGCYQLDKYNHNHNGKTWFLDNYTLLEAHKDSKLGVNRTEIMQNPSSSSLLPSPSSSSPKPSYSTALISASKMDQMKIAFRALEVALGIGSVSLAAAAAFCSIM